MSVGPFVSAIELEEHFGAASLLFAATDGERSTPPKVLTDADVQSRIDETARNASGLIATMVDPDKVDASVLRSWCLDITFYKLSRKPLSTHNEARKRYEDALEQLKLCAQKHRSDRRDDKELIKPEHTCHVIVTNFNPWDGV